MEPYSLYDSLTQLVVSAGLREKAWLFSKITYQRRGLYMFHGCESLVNRLERY